MLLLEQQLLTYCSLTNIGESPFMVLFMVIVGRNGRSRLTSQYTICCMVHIAFSFHYSRFMRILHAFY